MSLLVILMAGSASFNKEQPQANVPTIKEPDSFITIQGTTLKASVPPSFIASFAILGDLTSELKDYYLYDLLKPYDWDIDEAYQVLIYESGGNPKAVNWADKHRNCDGSFGLFQIACVHMENYGIKDYQELFEPEKNIGIAYDLWKKDGWGPWRNCWEDYLTN